MEDTVIFNHLLELSDGKINLHQSEEELSNSSDLMRINKKSSNKYSSGSYKNQAKKKVNPKQKTHKNTPK